MMNQQYDYPPPPPPPTSGGNASGPNSPRHQRPPLATNVVRTHGAPTQTPISATSFGTSTPFSLTPTTPGAVQFRTPTTLVPSNSGVSPRTSPRNSFMEPYDPRQWSNRGQVSGTQMVFQNRGSAGSANTRDVTGMEAAMPSPPPPYSPPATSGSINQIAQGSPGPENLVYTSSPVQTHSLSTTSTPVHASPNFPPPPGQSSRHRERSSSVQRGFLSLAGLRKSTNNETQATQATPATNTADLGDPRPPAAKRAASTGHIYNHGAGESSQAPQLGPARKSSAGSSWKPGMPLPGPPPGPPPPSGSRTQSLTRYPENSSRSNSVGSDRSLETPMKRRAAATSNLGPIPPTPADWVDPEARSQQPYQPLRIDTGSGRDGSLSRRPAHRDGAGQGIRERRSRSRAARDANDVLSPESDAPKPNNLVFDTSDGSINRRRERTRPRSAFISPATDTGTGPNSPSQRQRPSQAPTNNNNNVLTPPYTPAVSKSADDLLNRASFRVPESASSERQISQILHQSGDDSAYPAPLTTSKSASVTSPKVSARLDPFLLQALERHRAFIEKEASAASDEERLELFANFLVHESRLRRDRYAEAYNSMAGEIVDLTRDMWRSYARQSKRSITTSTSRSSFDPTLAAAYGNMPSSASSYEEYTPATDASSFLDGEGIDQSGTREWGETFKPSLSPIPSMNVSTVRDEEDSRGRAPSRWWEQSNSGSNSVGNPDRIEKSHRETKYMGVNPAALQDGQSHSPRSSWHTGNTPGPSTQNFYLGPNEYPPEKVGFHESNEIETPMPTPGRPRKLSREGNDPVDVSRLVTLPPPYPRHYPAVKNKHPSLSDLRSEYRSLADQMKIKDIKDAYSAQDWNAQRQQEQAATERRKHLRSDIHGKVSNGIISFAEAAQAEADFEVEEAERGKANARSNFDLFESGVAHPLNNLLTERLEKANSCIDQLRVELESGNEVLDPNQAQEEGDEHPERLEKLTLLKWIFEAREQLHKEMFELHADRSAKYSEVILTPYRIAKQQSKIDEANAFFTKDSYDRQIKFAKESLGRFEELQQIIDSNVSLGVEDQLSAFWDIAPSLLELVQYLPQDVSRLDIAIPEAEYEENPAYNDHPLQYLYSLLDHAQKSAYQFIESQTNLLCLLHEVRTATTKSNLRLLEVERIAANSDDANVRAEMQQARQAQEERLTEDLKEKVGEVDRQWREALGEQLEEYKDKVKTFLEESGGWEEGLEE